MSTPARPQPARPPAPQQQQIRPQQQTYRPQLAGQQSIRPQTPTYRPIPPPGQYAASSSSVSRPQTPVYRPPLQGTPTNGYRPQQQQGTYQRPPFNQQTPNQAQQQQQQQQFYRPKPRVVPEKDVQPGPFASSLGSMMFGFGDAGSSSKDTVHVMEDLLNRFITDLCTLPPLPPTTAPPKARQITFSHLHHRLSSHPSSQPLLHRLEELALLQKDIKAARRTMDPTFSTGMGREDDEGDLPGGAAGGRKRKGAGGGGPTVGGGQKKAKKD